MKTKDQWNQEGLTLFNNQQYHEAIADCDRALQLDPNYTDAKNRLTAYF
jgi:Flp pilus assembly protein TadD